MATIIDTTYFYEELQLAQLTEPAVQSSLSRYIQKGEAELLRDLLGYELYKDFLANQGSQRHQDILNGKEYTNRAGRLDKWRGLKEEVVAPITGADPKPGVYRSLIACYVYWHYVRATHTVTTGTGEKKAQTQNAVDASPADKLSRAWNQMVAWNRELTEFLQSNAAAYPEFEMRYSDNRFWRLLQPVNAFGL